MFAERIIIAPGVPLICFFSLWVGIPARDMRDVQTRSKLRLLSQLPAEGLEKVPRGFSDRFPSGNSNMSAVPGQSLANGADPHCHRQPTLISSRWKVLWSLEQVLVAPDLTMPE